MVYKYILSVYFSDSIHSFVNIVFKYPPHSKSKYKYIQSGLFLLRFFDL